ncbi:MAG TPA: hypothetical protein VFO58_12290 [Vicinamibacterales bacterium]|nr:hypothetical protein [Vicinamibacterales bacterium]
MRDAHTLSPAGEARVILGFAVQPFVTGLLGFGLFPVVDYTGRALYGGRPVDALDAAISLGAGVGIAGLLVTLFAFPTLMWLLKRGPVTRRHALISGAVLGNVPGALIVSLLAISRFRQGVMPGLGDLTYGPAGAIHAIVLGSFIGVTAAAVFRWLAGRSIVEGRP